MLLLLLAPLNDPSDQSFNFGGRLLLVLELAAAVDPSCLGLDLDGRPLLLMVMAALDGPSEGCLHSGCGAVLAKVGFLPLKACLPLLLLGRTQPRFLLAR